MPLSITIITRNAAGQLGRCLASVAFAEEIVVVDSGSTDGTVELAERHGARELDRAVRRTGVHHDDLLGKGDARKAAPQLAGGVAGDDRYGQGHGREKRDGKPV